MNPPPTLGQFENVFRNAVSGLLVIGGVALLIMLFSGGFKFLTSSGDPKKLEDAKKTLTFAIAGIVLLVGSYLILRVISDITNIGSILEFNIIHTQ